MLHRRLLILFNSFAGNGKPLFYKANIEKRLQETQLTFDAHIPLSEAHFDALILQAVELDYTDIVLVGGDGTLHRAVNIIMRQSETIRANISLGLISLGTGNDWIRTYHQDLTIEENIALIIRGNAVLQDIGKIETPNEITYFNNMAGFGFSGLVVYHSISFKKLGKLSYILGALRTLIGFRCTPVRISGSTFDYAISLFSLFAGIGRYAGGNMKLCPLAEPQDGIFHLTLIRKQSLLYLIQLIPKLFNGRLHESPFVQILETNSFTIEAKQSFNLPSEADGEAKQAAHYHIQLLPQALRFIV